MGGSVLQRMTANVYNRYLFYGRSIVMPREALLAGQGLTVPCRCACKAIMIQPIVQLQRLGKKVATVVPMVAYAWHQIW